VTAPDGTPILPAHLELLTSADGLVIRRRWLSARVAGLILVAVFWNAFLIFWYTVAFRSGRPVTTGIFWFPLLHVAVGLGLIYGIVASFKNVTDITVSSTQVRVASGPVPVPGNREVPVDSITAIRLREIVGSKGSRSYRVVYVDRAMRQKTLLALPSRDQAEYITATVRATLGLPEA
jgi:hypothetical protein